MNLQKKNEDVLGKSVVKESDNDVAKSDSGAGDSEADTKAEDDNTKNNELALLAGVVAPSIAAGGTVFATAAKRKVSRRGVPQHLRNVKSKLSKTFHENERYNFESGKEGDDSGVEDSQNSSVSKKSTARSASPVKRIPRQLNQDGKRVPRSRSVPKGTFTFSNSPSPSSSDMAKRVPVNKVQLGRSTLPNLKNIKSKVSSMNTAYKPGGGQVKIANRPMRKPRSRTHSESKEPEIKTSEEKKDVSNEEKPKPKKSRKHNIQELKARVAAKRSQYSRAWADPPPKTKSKEASQAPSPTKEDNDDKKDASDNEKEEVNEVEEKGGALGLEDTEKETGKKDESDDDQGKESDEERTSPSHSPSAPPAETIQGP